MSQNQITNASAATTAQTFGSLKIGEHFRVIDPATGKAHGMRETKISKGRSRFCEGGKMTDGTSRMAHNKPVVKL